MKRIGIVGGLGPEATLYYYRTLLDLCYEREELDGDYPEMIIYNLRIVECRHFMEQDRWDAFGKKIIRAFQALHHAGAEFGLIAANTPHLMFETIKEQSPMPLISIVEETCSAVEEKGLSNVGLIGTRFTMESHFYSDVFHKRNIGICVPQAEDREYIYEKITTELGVGIMREKTRQGYLAIVKKMIDTENIEGLILGCTEIPLLLTHDEFGIPFFDTSKIHARGALRYSMGE